ncbi:MAG TPA: DinB family protein [Tepidisphaeraceae bacterium]|nr:DinB family protein [Tepidisphaeraceae bacterium]
MDNNVILQAFAFQTNYLSLLVDDIADEKMCDQPGGVVNHPAWQLGHLALVSDRMTKVLGGSSSLDEAWEKKFAPKSIPSPRRADYPTKAELVRITSERRKAFADAFAKCNADDLAKPNPNQRATAFFPTVGHFALFGLLGHENGHLGQLACWRKAAGLPEALSKIQQMK